MSDCSGHVRGALRAIRVRTATTYSWRGERSPRLSPAVNRLLTEKTARTYLLHQLQSRLYADFYIRGGADVPSSESLWSNELGGCDASEFLETLVAANTSSGSWEGSWEVLSSTAEEVVVRRGGLSLWVRPDDCEAAGSGAMSPGGPVRLRLPREMLGVSPGYYLCCWRPGE